MHAPDLEKTHDIVFHALPTDQAQQAARLLSRIPHLHVTLFANERRVVVRYHLHEHSLAEIENGLMSQGFHLDGSLLQKLKRALVHYTEEVQLENLRHPGREHKTKQLYIHAWEHHPHGDHDDTPEELRHYF